MTRTLLSTALLATSLALAACGTPPRDLDLTLRHPSAQGRYVVQMEPPAAAPAINQMHAWQIRLNRPDGTPVRGALFAVDGGMPQHGHGLPTRPQVTEQLGGGRNKAEGKKFNMPGGWTTAG